MYNQIKPFTKNDKEIYLELSKNFYSSKAVNYPVADTNIIATFDACINKSPYTSGYLIHSDDIIAGYLLLSFTWSNEAGGICVLVEEIFILPEFQNKGLGSLVMGFLNDEFAHKVKRLRLEVVDDNYGAIKLYNRNGFEEYKYLQMVKDVD